jgi:hypothetical protein
VPFEVFISGLLEFSCKVCKVPYRWQSISNFAAELDADEDEQALSLIVYQPCIFDSCQQDK